MSDSVQPHGLQPTRPLHPWDFPGKKKSICMPSPRHCSKNKSICMTLWFAISITVLIRNLGKMWLWDDCGVRGDMKFIWHSIFWWLSSKESTCQCRRQGFNPSVGKIPWRRKWQLTPVLTPVFSPGKFHGQRSLVGFSPRGCKELNTTEWLWNPLWVNSQVLRRHQNERQGGILNSRKEILFSE